MSRYPLNLPTQLKQEAETLAAQQGVSLNQFILWAVAEKVGALRQKLDDPAFPQVTYRRGASGRPTPVLRDTGIRVQTVVAATSDWDMSPAEIAADYGISEQQVREGLAFYQVHRAEIDANIAEELAMEEAAMKADG